GGSVLASNLSAGVHIITAFIVDSEGFPATTHITITVTGGDPIVPASVIPLFNGSNLGGLYPWFSESGFADNNGVFTIEDGLLRVSGQRMGALITQDSYRDYVLILEFKWGVQTWS